MGTKLLLGFGGAVIQVVVHPVIFAAKAEAGFGGTVNQAVVHRGRGARSKTRFVSEVP